MQSGVPVRFSVLGLASVAAGLLALVLVAIPQWVAPPPPRPVQQHLTLKERIQEKLRNLGHRQEKVGHSTAGWREGVPFAAIVIALLAVLLGALSVLRGEEHLYAGVGTVLGIGAIAFQLTIFYAVGACVILIMYAAMERPAGAPVLAFFGICAGLVLSLLTVLGLDADSALLLAVAAVSIVSAKGVFGAFTRRHDPPAT